MCRTLVVTNQLVLGNRLLGYETYSLPKGEILEFTEKQLKDLIRLGRDHVYGMKISEEVGELVLDEEGFFIKNMMKKSHINTFVPLKEEDTFANIFYSVIGVRDNKGNKEYNIISSRYERIWITEEKLKTMYEMGVISAGVKVENGKITVAINAKKSEENIPGSEKLEHKELDKSQSTTQQKSGVFIVNNKKN